VSDEDEGSSRETSSSVRQMPKQATATPEEKTRKCDSRRKSGFPTASNSSSMDAGGPCVCGCTCTAFASAVRAKGKKAFGGQGIRLQLLKGGEETGAGMFKGSSELVFCDRVFQSGTGKGGEGVLKPWIVRRGEAQEVWEVNVNKDGAVVRDPRTPHVLGVNNFAQNNRLEMAFWQCDVINY
jgi:hypothetical protein